MVSAEQLYGCWCHGSATHALEGLLCPIRDTHPCSGLMRLMNLIGRCVGAWEEGEERVILAVLPRTVDADSQTLND